MSVTFSLGLSALLADPADEQPGGYYRDELLFHLIDCGGDLEDAFELREVLSADLPMASGSEGDTGDLVVIAKRGVGGPLRPEVGEHLLWKWMRTAKRATVATSAESLDIEGPTILVPPFYPTITIPAGKHPFAGVRVMPADVMRDAVRAFAVRGGESDEAIEMLRLCVVHGFVVTAVETAS